MTLKRYTNIDVVTNPVFAETPVINSHRIAYYFVSESWIETAEGFDC